MRDLFGNLVGKVTVDANTVGETSVRLASTSILKIVVKDEGFLGAKLFIASLTVFTFTTGIGQAADTYNIADFVMSIGAYSGHLANNLVSDNDVLLERTPASGDGVDIRTTDTAVGDLNLDILGTQGARVVTPWLQVGGSG